MKLATDSLTICNISRDEELSKRISARLQCSAVPSVCYDPRPVPTKYTDFQIMDARPNGISHNTPTLHCSEKSFFCGTTKAPWNGFASAIDDESTLRNQFFALQKCEQSNYVPSTNSDMYAVDAQPPAPLSLTLDNEVCGSQFNQSTRVERLNSDCKC